MSTQTSCFLVYFVDKYISFLRLLPASCFPYALCPMLYASSHPELEKEVPRFNNSGHPDQDERETNPEGFELAIAEETEQRVGDKNESSDRGEQNQCEKVVGVTVSHQVEIDHRTGNQ